MYSIILLRRRGIHGLVFRKKGPDCYGRPSLRLPADWLLDELAAIKSLASLKLMFLIMPTQGLGLDFNELYRFTSEYLANASS